MTPANDNTSPALLWTCKQTAAALGVTTKTLLAHVQSGELRELLVRTIAVYDELLEHCR